MTDKITLLRQSEAANKARTLSRSEKEKLLRSTGWQRLTTTGTQRWQNRDGDTATLSGAAVWQIFQDLNA